MSKFFFHLAQERSVIPAHPSCCSFFLLNINILNSFKGGQSFRLTSLFRILHLLYPLPSVSLFPRTVSHSGPPFLSSPILFQLIYSTQRTVSHSGSPFLLILQSSTTSTPSNTVSYSGSSLSFLPFLHFPLFYPKNGWSFWLIFLGGYLSPSFTPLWIKFSESFWLTSLVIPSPRSFFGPNTSTQDHSYQFILSQIVHSSFPPHPLFLEISEIFE